MNNFNVDHIKDNITKKMEKVEKIMESMFGSKYLEDNKNNYNLVENHGMNNVELLSTLNNDYSKVNNNIKSLNNKSMISFWINNI
jgi:predicted transcriptional regulator